MAAVAAGFTFWNSSLPVTSSEAQDQRKTLPTAGSIDVTPLGQLLYREVLTHVNGRKKFKQNPGLPPRQDSENKRPTSLLAEPGNESRLEIKGGGDIQSPFILPQNGDSSSSPAPGQLGVMSTNK